MSGGRFDLGVGIGWLAEELTAVNVPWERRAERTREYLKAMKLLWTEEEPEFKGEFLSFPKVRMYPKPVQKPYPPIIFGGESIPALKRVGEVGDGWFGVNVTPEAAPNLVARMQNYARAAGRGNVKLSFAVSPGIGSPVELDAIKKYRDAGVHEVIVGALPSDPKQVKGEIGADWPRNSWCRRQNSKSRRSVINDQHSVFVRKVFSCLPFEVEGRKLMATAIVVPFFTAFPWPIDEADHTGNTCANIFRT